MTTTTKARPVATRDDVARGRLADAQASLSAQHADVAAAEEALTTARHDYGAAQLEVEAIVAHMNALAEESRRVHSAGRGPLLARYDDANLSLAAAKLPLPSLRQAEEAAAENLRRAEGRLDFCRSRVHAFATSVVRAEAPAAVEAMLPALAAAFDALLQHGPVVNYLVDTGLVSTAAVDQAIGEGPRRMLTTLQGWDAYERRHRTSPWRSVVPALEADAEAALPSVG